MVCSDAVVMNSRLERGARGKMDWARQNSSGLGLEITPAAWSEISSRGLGRRESTVPVDKKGPVLLCAGDFPNLQNINKVN